MKKLFIFTIVIVQLLGCSSPKTQGTQSSNPYSQYIRYYNKADIDSIIQHNDYTIIFGWTEWCRGGHNQLKEYLIPFLKEKRDNIGVISICCANPNKLVDFVEQNDCKHPIYLLSGSWSGLDKWRLNRRFHAIFDNYQSVNYVPIAILCDNQKQILNWDAVNKVYHGLGSSILQIKNNNY